VAIAVFGSESIKGFGVAMAVGIVVGTYSSIYIAAPVTVFVHEFRERQQNRPGGAKKADTAGAQQAVRQS
jgi:preprotein translocase subunit SecF